MILNVSKLQAIAIAECALHYYIEIVPSHLYSLQGTLQR